MRDLKNMQINTLTLGAVSAALAVGIGAFGAHGLDSYLGEHFSLSSDQIDKQIINWKTGAHYHLIHAIGLILCFLVSSHQNIHQKRVRRTIVFFLMGTLLFSGSLYILVLSQIKILGAIVPLGESLLFWVGCF